MQTQQDFLTALRAEQDELGRTHPDAVALHQARAELAEVRQRQAANRVRQAAIAEQAVAGDVAAAPGDVTLLLTAPALDAREQQLAGQVELLQARALRSLEAANRELVRAWILRTARAGHEKKEEANRQVAGLLSEAAAALAAANLVERSTQDFGFGLVMAAACVQRPVKPPPAPEFPSRVRRHQPA
jgi:hypothetical protein